MNEIKTERKSSNIGKLEYIDPNFKKILRKSTLQLLYKTSLHDTDRFYQLSMSSILWGTNISGSISNASGKEFLTDLFNTLEIKDLFGRLHITRYELVSTLDTVYINLYNERELRVFDYIL